MTKRHSACSQGMHKVTAVLGKLESLPWKDRFDMLSLHRIGE